MGHLKHFPSHTGRGESDECFTKPNDGHTIRKFPHVKANGELRNKYIVKTAIKDHETLSYGVWHVDHLRCGVLSNRQIICIDDALFPNTYLSRNYSESRTIMQRILISHIYIYIKCSLLYFDNFVYGAISWKLSPREYQTWMTFISSLDNRFSMCCQ